MKKIFIALFTMLFVSTAAFAQSDLQVLAVVKYNKSESITVRQLKKRVAVYESQIGRSLTLEDKKDVLNTLIEEKLILQAAEKAGLKVSESDATKFYEASMSQLAGFNVTEQQFDEIVKKQYGLDIDDFFMQQVGMNKAEYKEHLKNQFVMQQYILAINQEKLQKIGPTDEQIRMAYEANKTTFVWNDMAKLLIVAVPKGDNSADSKVKLNELKNKYTNKKVSVDEILIQAQAANSGFEAGEMLVEKNERFAIGLGMNMKDFLNLFDNKVGYITDVIETERDYRFLSLITKYDAKMLGIGDIVQPETTITVYDFIRQNLTNQLRGQYLQQATLDLAKSLNVPANVEMKKSGSSLDKLLNWGE